MKIYFAGPLFTPYVRDFISAKAKILRENGIEVFVPHEKSFDVITPEKVAALLAQGLISPEDLDGKLAAEVVMDLVRAGRLTREQVGMPAVSADAVFDIDYSGLSTADAVLAILDGTQVDDGTACEIGIFYALMLKDPTKKGIVSLMTDSRGIRKKEQGFGLNYFVLGILEDTGKVYDSFEDALGHLKTWDAEMKSN
jgi:nucleoside 2-deoxyribosyltransferase